MISVKNKKNHKETLLTNAMLYNIKNRDLFYEASTTDKNTTKKNIIILKILELNTLSYIDKKIMINKIVISSDILSDLEFVRWVLRNTKHQLLFEVTFSSNLILNNFRAIKACKLIKDDEHRLTLIESKHCLFDYTNLIAWDNIKEFENYYIN